MPNVLGAMLANNFSTSTCFAIFELIKFMCCGSTLSYPHEEFVNPCLSRPVASPTRTCPTPACIAVQVPTCIPQMRIPTTRVGQPAPSRTLVCIYIFIELCINQKQFEQTLITTLKCVKQIWDCVYYPTGHSMSNHPKKDNSKPYTFRIWWNLAYMLVSAPKPQF